MLGLPEANSRKCCVCPVGGSTNAFRMWEREGGRVGQSGCGGGSWIDGCVKPVVAYIFLDI